MPSAVTAIFGADASPVVAAFNVVTAAAAGSASATASNMRMAIKEIEKLKVAAIAAGQGTGIYDASLQKLTADLAANEAATKRVITAQERLAQMRASAALRANAPDVITPMAMKTLTAIGVEDEIARSVARAAGAKQAAETAEQYRDRLFKKHAEMGYVSNSGINIGSKQAALRAQGYSHEDIAAALDSQLKQEREIRAKNFAILERDNEHRKQQKEKYGLKAPMPGEAGFIGPIPNPKELEEAGKQGGAHLARGWRLAGPMFVSAARDTAASLASGAPLTTVFMQQAPQVLQAMQMVGMAGLKAMVAPFIALFAGALAVGAIIAAPFIFKARVNAIARALSEVELPDLDRTYIPSINRAAEAWLKVKEAIDDVVKSFFGANESAERMTAISDRRFTHEAKMAELERTKELSKATSSYQRNAINERYDAKAIERENRQQDTNNAIQKKRIESLKVESVKAEVEAEKLNQSNPAKNARNRADIEARAKASRELLDKEEKDKTAQDQEGWMGAAWRWTKREIGAKAKYGLNPYEAASGLMDEEAQKVLNSDMARGNIAYLNREKDKDAARKVKDEQAQKLSAESVAKAKEAKELELKLAADMDQQKAKRAERLAEISAERRNANAEALSAGANDGRGMLTANQRMGAYAPAAAAVSTVGTKQLDVQGRIEKLVGEISKKMGADGGSNGEVPGF